MHSFLYANWNNFKDILNTFLSVTNITTVLFMHSFSIFHKTQNRLWYCYFLCGSFPSRIDCIFCRGPYSLQAIPGNHPSEETPLKAANPMVASLWSAFSVSVSSGSEPEVSRGNLKSLPVGLSLRAPLRLKRAAISIMARGKGKW